MFQLCSSVARSGAGGARRCGVDLALDGAGNGQTAVSRAGQGHEPRPFQGLAEGHPRPVDEDEAALIGADDLAAAAAESQEAEPHLLEPGGAELDLRLVLGHDVELRRLALAADLDRIADSLVK